MINEKLQSFKNSIEDKAGWVATKFTRDEILEKRTANLIQPIEDVSSIFSLLYRFFLNI